MLLIYLLKIVCQKLVKLKCDSMLALAPLWFPDFEVASFSISGKEEEKQAEQWDCGRLATSFLLLNSSHSLSSDGKTVALIAEPLLIMLTENLLNEVLISN